MSEADEVMAFIRDAARRRGINEWIALAVASTEGRFEYAAHGDFETGDSWWPFQLHYGGPGYEHFGTTPGMGNGFTALTGWAPGDPLAWRDSIRYALNRAKRSGWGAWYGALAIGISGYAGIDRTSPWDANAEPWDFESGKDQDVPDRYDEQYPAFAQNDPWSCGPTSLRWALHALGRRPSESWIEGMMLERGLVTREHGIMDASGAGIARLVRNEYGEFGITANHDPGSSPGWSELAYEALLAEAGAYPILIGGRRWNHWSGVRGKVGDTLALANPSEGWMGVGQTMNWAQFATLGPFSMVRVYYQQTA